MRFGDVLRTLRFVRDVLAEYAATEKLKREAAKQRAAEAAAREAEETAAREAEWKAAQERLLAEQQAKQGRRRRRGEPVKASVPLHSITTPPVQDAVYNVSQGTGPSPGPLDGVPPMLIELLKQLQALDGAIRSLFTVTAETRAWFERIQTNPRWRRMVVAVSTTIALLAPRISSRMYQRKLIEEQRRRWDENRRRVQRMFEGGWREKVRYLLWTNGQRQDRAATMQVGATFAAASGWD